ncbi:MAG: leucine-rich repeat protein, partial [Clostridia bacterium]|nr:leucine-rich repeat protein [Clostridia bacterium]
TNLKKINYLGSIDDWVNIKFLGSMSNPLSQGAGLYIDGQLQQNITISSQKVSEYAFYNYLKLTDVTFTEDVTEIDSYAFAECENLQQLQLPIKLKYIGTQAFAFCGGIQTVTLPKTLEDMGVGAFSGCRSLQEILLEEGIENYYTIDGNLYGTVDGVTKLYHYLKTNTNSSFKIPDGVNEIIDGAFRDSFYLQHVEIPDSVTVIGAFAFYNCQYLETVKMSANIKTIEDSAFEYCIRLENVDLGEKLTSIGSRAFYYCLSLTQVNMPNTLTSIGSECFYSCAQLEQVTLSDRLIAIPSYAFSYCLALQTVNGGSLVQQIESQAFAYCSSLKNVDFAKKAIIVGFEAFAYCTSIEEFEITNNVVGFFYNALQGCENLKTLTVSTTFYSEFVMYNGGMIALTKMSELTLTLGNVDLENLVITAPFTKINRIDCSGIENITISSSVTEIGARAFEDIKNLKTVNLENVDVLGSGAFANCCDLETVILSKNLTSLGGAFIGCVSLTNIDLSNVVEIGGWAFSGCTFTTLNLPNVTTLYDGAFENCQSLTSIQLPSLMTAGNSVFKDCAMLENVELGDNVISIGDNFFANCKSLKQITIPSSVQSIGEYIFKGACIEKLNVGMTTIPRNMFVYIESIGEVELLDTVRRIEDYAFQDINGAKLYLSDNLTYIGGQAFWPSNALILTEYNDCTYLGSKQNPYLVLMEVLDKTVSTFETQTQTKFIYSEAFQSCRNLYSIVLTENIIQISDWVFSDCMKLVEVYNLSNLDITLYSTDNGAVGMWAFDIYTSKDQQSKIFDVNGYKVYEGEGNRYVLAYDGTDTHIAFPYTNAMSYAFYLNQNVQSAIIYEYWGICLDVGTFMGCSNLQTVTISNSVRQIKDFVFVGCLNLETIIYNGTIEEWERVDKEDYWNEGLIKTATVKCTDGEVSIFKN